MNPAVCEEFSSESLIEIGREHAFLTVRKLKNRFEPRGVVSPAGWKTHAFKECIEAFYSRYPNQRCAESFIFASACLLLSGTVLR